VITAAEMSVEAWLAWRWAMFAEPGEPTFRCGHLRSVYGRAFVLKGTPYTRCGKCQDDKHYKARKRARTQ
jgi:hypothetical protein